MTLKGILSANEYNPVLGIVISPSYTLELLAERSAVIKDVEAVTMLVVGALSPLDSALRGVPSQLSSSDEQLRQQQANEIDTGNGVDLSEIISQRVGTPTSYCVLGAILLTCAGHQPIIGVTSKYAEKPNYPFVELKMPDGTRILDLHGMALGKPTTQFRADRYALLMQE
jgi:hypothetical protein